MQKFIVVPFFATLAAVVLFSCTPDSKSAPEIKPEQRAMALPPQTSAVFNHRCGPGPTCPETTDCISWTMKETPLGCMCEGVPAPMGTDCKQGACDGNGNCACGVKEDGGTTCPKMECWSDVCCQGRCAYVPKEVGAPCPGGGCVKKTPESPIECTVW